MLKKTLERRGGREEPEERRNRVYSKRKIQVKIKGHDCVEKNAWRFSRYKKKVSSFHVTLVHSG